MGSDHVGLGVVVLLLELSYALKSKYLWIMSTNLVDIASKWVVGGRRRRDGQLLLHRHRQLHDVDSNSMGNNDGHKSAERRALLDL